MITTLTTICNKIWQTGEWPTPWTQSLIITLPKKGNLQMRQNYRTISLISHPSKVMLKILLNSTDSNLRQKRSSLKNKWVFEQDGATVNRSSTLECFARNKVETLMERQKHHCQFENKADVLPCPSFCTLLKHGPSQQIYRRGYKQSLYASETWTLSADLQKRIPWN